MYKIPFEAYTFEMPLLMDVLCMYNNTILLYYILNYTKLYYTILYNYNMQK